MIGLAGLTEADLLGSSVWSRTHGYEGVDEAGDQLAPKGGLIIGVDRDPDTGYRVFRTVDFRRGAVVFAGVREDDIALAGPEPVNTSTVRSTIRRLCERVARSKGPMTSEDFDQLAAAHVLCAALKGERG